MSSCYEFIGVHSSDMQNNHLLHVNVDFCIHLLDIFNSKLSPALIFNSLFTSLWCCSLFSMPLIVLTNFYPCITSFFFPPFTSFKVFTVHFLQFSFPVKMKFTLENTLKEHSGIIPRTFTHCQSGCAHQACHSLRCYNHSVEIENRKPQNIVQLHLQYMPWEEKNWKSGWVTWSCLSRLSAACMREFARWHSLIPFCIHMDPFNL